MVAFVTLLLCLLGAAFVTENTMPVTAMTMIDQEGNNGLRYRSDWPTLVVTSGATTNITREIVSDVMFALTSNLTASVAVLIGSTKLNIPDIYI